MGLSRRAYAARRGVSDMAVRKAIKSGRIQVEPDGTIDPEKADADWNRRTEPGRRPIAMSAPVVPPEFPVAGDLLQDEDEPISFSDARAKHESAKARLAEVRLQKVRGELVERDRATALVFRLAREERDAWVNWPARVAALMAAELGVETAAMQKVLEAYVREHLGELAEIDIAI